MMWPPQSLHHLRSLPGVFAYVPILSAPFVTFTDAGFHNVNALTGPADQCGTTRSGNTPCPRVRR